MIEVGRSKAVGEGHNGSDFRQTKVLKEGLLISILNCDSDQAVVRTHTHALAHASPELSHIDKQASN